MREAGPATRLLWTLCFLLVGCGGAARTPSLPPGEGPPDAARPDPVALTAIDLEAGERLDGRIGCNGCHTIDGIGGRVGPDLSDIGTRPSPDPARWSTAEAYIRSSIETPNAFVPAGYTPMMPPPEQLGIDATDIRVLVEYLLAQGS